MINLTKQEINLIEDLIHQQLDEMNIQTSELLITQHLLILEKLKQYGI